jgi:hypothetical protein
MKTKTPEELTRQASDEILAAVRAEILRLIGSGAEHFAKRRPPITYLDGWDDAIVAAAKLFERAGMAPPFVVASTNGTHP